MTASDCWDRQSSARAFDISPESIRLAPEPERAARDAAGGVHFEVADCDCHDDPHHRYHAVFFHGSMHQMSDPAALLDRIAPALRKGALLFPDDYVGPSREQWPHVGLSLARHAFLEMGPLRRDARLRRHPARAVAEPVLNTLIARERQPVRDGQITEPHFVRLVGRKS